MASPSRTPARGGWLPAFWKSSTDQESDDEKGGHAKWSMGVLNDKATVEVPGSVLLLARNRNEPLGLRNAPARTSHSSIPTGMPRDLPQALEETKKKTSDGKIILDPQPEDSANDPLNWPVWRRDCALLSLGCYCMVGGGLTTILAAGFTNIATDYDVHVSRVSLTTGLYMMGMGLGSVVFSPTAILYGKRPVYLASAVILICCSVWCALSPNFTSLLLARIFQGVAISPIECLPSATIAEIFFLHERAFRIGTYTLLLLGGKNLVPLVSAAIMQRLGWRWVFWIVALVAAFCGILLFLFVPETFWDRAPIPKSRRPSPRRPSHFFRRYSSKYATSGAHPATPRRNADLTTAEAIQHRSKIAPVGFVPGFEPETHGGVTHPTSSPLLPRSRTIGLPKSPLTDGSNRVGFAEDTKSIPIQVDGNSKDVDAPHPAEFAERREALPPIPTSPSLQSLPHEAIDGAEATLPTAKNPGTVKPSSTPRDYFTPAPHQSDIDSEKQSTSSKSVAPGGKTYTLALRDQPAQSFVQQLKLFHGRLNQDNWFKVMVRPFILFSYPSVLWSAGVYACSVGWLIVISESVAVIYRDTDSYNFDAFQTGLVYISPFIGGILGTAVAGKVSDIVVKAMAARNGGLYEPEFRLVMAAPITITTVIGLIGFGWSAQEKDAWIVPTVFFGLVSFGCSLGSTTAITFCVDSYRQYAGEALVTLNFTKNILHGLVFSLFVTGWITQDGPKTVYIWIGVMQLILLVFTIPMYIYGKRARMWTVRKNFMEKF